MSERGIQLQETANRQISELTGLFSTHGEEALRLLCPGREKLGDGTVAAIALHTADNYHRITGFLQATDEMPPTHAQGEHRRHRLPALLRHRGRGADNHDGQSRRSLRPCRSPAPVPPPDQHAVDEQQAADDLQAADRARVLGLGFARYSSSPDEEGGRSACAALR